VQRGASDSLFGSEAGDDVHASAVAEGACACGGDGLLRGLRELGVGGASKQELMSAVELGLTSRSEQAVAADMMQARGKDVLEQAMEQDQSGKGLVYGFSSTVAEETKGDLSVFETLEPAVGQRALEQVATKVVEDSLTAARMLSVHDPGRSP
jgi:hypothetical protein